MRLVEQSLLVRAAARAIDSDVAPNPVSFMGKIIGVNPRPLIT
jgi:hypothetical protein